MHKVHWLSCFGDASGYGHVARAYVKAMNEAGWDIKIGVNNFTIDDQTKYLGDFFEYFKPLIVENINRIKANERIFVSHNTPDILFVQPQFKINSAMSMWETNSINSNSAKRCNDFDFLMTASEFSKSAFVTGGVTLPIHVIPHIVPRITLPRDEKLHEFKKDRLTFLSIFEWHLGKGYDLLLKGFVEAFKDNPNVLLILKVNDFVSPKTLKERVFKYIKSIKKDLIYPSILPICHPCLPEIIYSLYEVSDIYVSLTRREAFSLNLADAIVHEKLTICPSRGGHREYANENNSILINSDWSKIVNIEPERRNYLGQYWIESDLNDFIDKLKIVETNWREPKKEDIEELKKESELVRIKLSPETILNEFDKIFSFYEKST